MKGFSQLDVCDKEPPDWRSLSLRVSRRSSPKKERKREKEREKTESRPLNIMDAKYCARELAVIVRNIFFSFFCIIGSTRKLLMRFHSLLVGVDTGWNSQVWFWTDTQQEAEINTSRGPPPPNRQLAHFHRELAQLDWKLAQLYRKLAQLHRKLAQLHRKLAQPPTLVLTGWFTVWPLKRGPRPHSCRPLS